MPYPMDPIRASASIPYSGRHGNRVQAEPPKKTPDFRLREPGQGARGEQMKILLVDNNALFLASAQRFLSNFAAVEAIATARGGLEALDHVGREHTDMVLMDLNMPGMNGFEATRRIKAFDPCIRVIVVSQHDGEEFKTAAAHAGAENFVAKQDFAAMLTALLQISSTGATPVITPAKAGNGDG